MTTVLAPALGVGFQQHAADAPDRPALIIGDRVLGYGECDHIARRWAARLVDVVGGRAARVGVFGYRSMTSYLGVIAALYAGAAFVPLNPRFPVWRTRTMVESADLDAVIVDDAAAEQLPDVLGGLARPPSVLLTGSWRPELPDARVIVGSDLASATPLAVPVTACPDDLAYLLFTSGSTGAPKGVPITHGNVCAFIGHNQQRYGIKPSDRFSQTFDQTFDLSVFDLFMAWEHGAALCAMDPIELITPFHFLERNAVTIWFSVPSAADLLRKRDVLRPGVMPTLRYSLFCGEPLLKSTAEAWQVAAPNSVVDNLYGPTELTIACAVHRWDSIKSPELCVHDTVPIGRFYPGLHPLIVNEDLQPVSDGIEGELCVAGAQTTPGYWRARGLTSERFFDRDGRRYYRTGDNVRRVGAEYLYLGRSDQQVKIGGHRVELGEIEAALRRCGAADAVCLLWPDENTIQAVVSGTSQTPAQLIKEAAKCLPAYMVPRSIHPIDEMMLNNNGKIDRRALREWLSVRHERQTKAVERGNPASVEELVSAVFSIPLEQVTDTLEYQSIRQWDSLGHVALIVALEKAYGWEAEERRLLDLRSVAAIKEFINRKPPRVAPAAVTKMTVRRGLEDVAFDRTRITHINGDAGVLEYRGYSIHDLAEHSTYEDVAHLLIFGEFPDAAARDAFGKQMAAGRAIPQPVLGLLRSLRHAHPMDALLAAVPALQAYGSTRIGSEDQSHEQARSVGIALIGAVPMLVAAHHAYRTGREFVIPPEDLTHAEAFLTALLGSGPTPAAVRIINKSLVIHADHSSNASAFAARVVTSCRANMNASITAAIAAFTGSVHGGAAERAVRLVDQVGDPDNAQRFVEESMRRSEPVMGFGHRVYRTEDPRVRHLRAAVLELSREQGDDSGLRILDAVAEAMAPYRRHGLAPNVDLYSALAYRLLDLPDDLAVAMFVIGRTAGWAAQVLEQHANNVLIRPLLEYTGPRGRTLPEDTEQR